MTPSPADSLPAFSWKPQPEAERLIRSWIDPFLSFNPWARTLSQRMRTETGTRFLDWVEALVIPGEAASREDLYRTGFRATGEDDCGREIWQHPAALFPRVGLSQDGPRQVFIRVDSVVDFLSRHADAPAGMIDGGPWSPVRRVRLGDAGKNELWALEQHGSRNLTVPPADPARAGSCLAILESFRLRRRDFETEGEGFEHAAELIDRAIEGVGQDCACHLFFQAEREFWQRRNRAARAQWQRQDRLGLGWANHDHHTYRSSRANFVRLISVFERLGFRTRERFYAGKEAGWGAQVLEQEEARIVIFADVDLSPEELVTDFAHEPLPPRSTLGTVGLWCGLHGDSFLQAGLHHLECQFAFDALREQLRSEASIGMMAPFTDFPHLRQAFTEGEIWPVATERVERLRDGGYITSEQAERFLANGAVGSHLENLERNGGFKGFNQRGVSEIIAATDPRKIASSSS